MGFVVFLIIVVIIIVVVKKNKKENEIEELKNSRTCEVALKIKEELEKKGYDCGEPSFDYSRRAYGDIVYMHYSGTEYTSYHIMFSNRTGGLDISLNLHRMRKASGKRYYGILNENIGIFVYQSLSETDDMPEFIKIAAAVIIMCGYGESELI